MQPILIEAVGSFNIVSWNGEFLGIPHGLEFNFQEDDFNKNSSALLIGPSVEDVKSSILSKYRTYNPHTWGMENFLQEHANLDELDLPEVIEIEPIHSCNFRCVMCHVPYEKLTKQRIDVKKLLSQLDGLEGRWVTLAASYESTVHPKFVQLVNGLTDKGVKLDMCTNGSLFSDKLINNIRDINLRSLSLSFDGATKNTFELIRPGSNYDRVIERMRNLKAAFASKNTYFSVNQTVMRSNIEETTQSVDLWENMGFDHLGFIYMRIRSDTAQLRAECLDAEMEYAQSKLDSAAIHLIEKKYRLVLSSSGFQTSNIRIKFPNNIKGSIIHSDNPLYRIPANPREYFQNGRYPGMEVACRSPFKFAKINYNGDVILCQRYSVGNIYEKSFKDIWYGEKATNLRKAIMNEPVFCKTCDHYKYCIKAGEIDLTQKNNFIALSDNSKNFDIPTLVRKYKLFAIFRWGDQYYVTPRFGGDVLRLMLAGDTYTAETFYRVPTEEAGIRKCDEILVSPVQLLNIIIALLIRIYNKQIFPITNLPFIFIRKVIIKTRLIFFSPLK